MAVVGYCECRHHHDDGYGRTGRSHRHRHDAAHHEGAITDLHLEGPDGRWHKAGERRDECWDCRARPAPDTEAR